MSRKGIEAEKHYEKNKDTLGIFPSVSPSLCGIRLYAKGGFATVGADLG